LGGIWVSAGSITISLRAEKPRNYRDFELILEVFRLFRRDSTVWSAEGQFGGWAPVFKIENFIG
jgi:hypothetical protein